MSLSVLIHTQSNYFCDNGYKGGLNKFMVVEWLLAIPAKWNSKGKISEYQCPSWGKVGGGGGGGPLFLASMASLEHHSFFGHYVKQNVGLSNPFGLIQQDCYIGHMKQSYTEPDF